jgi:hypothetical protein
VCLGTCAGVGVGVGAWLTLVLGSDGAPRGPPSHTPRAYTHTRARAHTHTQALLHPVVVTALVANAGAALHGAVYGVSYDTALKMYYSKVCTCVCVWLYM